MLYSLRTSDSFGLRFYLRPACSTVHEVYNQQGGVLGFSYERPGLGVVWAVPIDFPPSEVPSTTLVPCQMARMRAGTIDSMVLNCQQLPPLPLGPPHRPPSRFDIILIVIPTIKSNIPLDRPLREDPESA